jgi:hypothetical protein
VTTVHLASSGASSLPQLVFVLFAGAVWLVKLLNRPKPSPAGSVPNPQRSEETQADEPDIAAPADPEAEERANRVREEILRKIAERNPSASAGQLRSLVKAAYQRREPVGGAAKRPAAQPARMAQQAIPAFAPPAGAAAAGAPAKTAGALWLDELRSRDSARRAILVREILGPPIALR